MDKLSEEDQERFQSVYCGLCYELGRQYGFAARFILNYDFTFLAILLSEGEGKQADYRCPCKYFCKKQRTESCAPLEYAADASVILSYWKVQDEIQDSAFVHGLGYRLIRLLFGPAYRRAAGKRPAFAGAVEENLRKLRQMEEEKVPSLDRTADAFATLLASAADEMGEDAKKQIHHQLLYHLGRWIYLIDALDDLKDDAQEGKYNPLIYRYQLENGVLDDDSRSRLVATLDHSANLIASAFALADYGPWRGILENIIYYGLPATGRMVLEGKWNAAEYGGGVCFKAGHGIAQRRKDEIE